MPTRLLCPWDSPGKNTGVDCHFLLQEIFLTQGLNLGLPHCITTKCSGNKQPSSNGIQSNESEDDSRSQENNGEDLRNIYQRPYKNQRTEMTNTIEEINSRITVAEEQINDLEDRMVEITAAEQRHNIKCTKIHI